MHEDACHVHACSGVFYLEADSEAVGLHDRLERDVDVVQRGVGLFCVCVERTLANCGDFALHLSHGRVECSLGCLGLHALMHSQQAFHLLDVASWVGGSAADDGHDAGVCGDILDQTARDAAGAGANNAGRRSAYRAIEDTMRERAAAARPLYERAYQEPVPWTHDLEALMGRPAMQTAYRDATNRAANQGRPFYGRFIDLADDGSFTVREVPSTGDLDIMKRNLDDQIGAYIRSGENGRAADIQGIRTQLLNIMDEHSPTYAQARAAWSGPSRYIEAIENGRGIFNKNKSAEEFADEIRRMSPAEQEAFRTGAVSSIVSKMGDRRSAVADVTTDLTSANMRAKIDALLPNDAARARWQEVLDQEVAASALSRRATGNSSTARRLAEMDDNDGAVETVASAARSLFTGRNLTELLTGLMRGTYRAGRDRVRARSDAAVADRLIDPNAAAAPVEAVGAPSLTVGQGGASGAVTGSLGAAGPQLEPALINQASTPRMQAAGTQDDQQDQRPVARPAQIDPPKLIDTGGPGPGSAMPPAKPGADLLPSEEGGSQDLLPSSRADRASLPPAKALDLAARDAAMSPDNDLPEPTQAQKEAGNYRKGHIKLQGLNIAIENPRGSERKGVDGTGKEWSRSMSDHYGYIKRTTGADGDQVDVYVGPEPYSQRVFVVDQKDQGSGKFDEHKVMLGYTSQAAAVKAYRSNFDKGWSVGDVTEMKMPEFKAWLKAGDTAKPVAAGGSRPTLKSLNAKIAAVRLSGLSPDRKERELIKLTQEREKLAS